MRAAITALALLIGWCAPAMADESITSCFTANAANPEFAALRSKMALLISSEQPFAMLSNTSKPTRAEKKLIAAWANEFERCSKLGRAEREGSQLGPLVNNYHSTLIAAAADLHASKISYGQYAKRQQEMFAEFDAKVTAFEEARNQQQAAMQAEERRQADMQRQAAAQDEQARRQMALQYMLNRPQSQPYQMPVPRQPVQTNCSTYGNQTNCTTR